MSAILNAQVPQIPGIVINASVEAAIKKALAAELWKWIDNHANDVVWNVKFWIVSKTFRVKDLHAVFAIILGAHP